jgi:protoporphyrinogen IX oxidase
MTAGLYPWLKAFHIIAIIAWMAGMLYLPRLFVYHSVAEIGSVQSETFKVMERRLLRAIINPAMIAAWVLGLWLAWSGNWISAPWLHAKVVLVLVLSGFHGMLVRWTTEVLPDHERGADPPHDRHRPSRRPQAVLTKITALVSGTLALGPDFSYVVAISPNAGRYFRGRPQLGLTRCIRPEV